MKRLVWLGRKPIAGPFAYHWAIKIGEEDENADWYEIDGAGKNNKGEYNTINGDSSDSGRPYWGRSSRNNAKPFGLAGVTYKDEDEIAKFNKKWLRNNPYYDVKTDNCQIFAYDLIQWLTDGDFKLPPMESGLGAWADGAGAHAVNRDGYKGARAHMGKAGAQWGPVGVEAAGPSAGAEAMCGDAGYGAFADASLGRAEAKLGKYVGATVEPNLNTGIGYRDGELSVKVAGWGYSSTGGGVGIHTPLGSLKFSLW